MPPVNLIYGKRRTFFRPMDSLCPQKSMTEPIQAKKKGTLGTSISVASEITKNSPRKRINCQTSIEEMASRLLDDSNSMLEELSLSASMPDSKFDYLVSSTSSSDCDPNPSTHSQVSSKEKPTELGESYSPTTPSSTKFQARECLPTIPVNSGEQNNISLLKSDSPHKLEETGKQQLLTKFKVVGFSSLEAHHPGSLKASVSAPVSNSGRNVSKGNVPNTETKSIDPENIANKLQAMLAATDSLKPTPKKEQAPPASKFTRMVSYSKMFVKVTHAWNRLHSKASFESLKARGRRNSQSLGEPSKEVIKPLLPPLTSPPFVSPISTIEIRLNEGDNLNKRKVQRIVGGQVARKPVADDGKSLRSRRSLEDPFSENGRKRTPTSFETLLKKGVDCGRDSIPPLPCDPFESEKDFDRNIEDRILSIMPVGSSTPRVRVDRVSKLSIDDSPSTQVNVAVKSMLDSVTTKVATEELRKARLLSLTNVNAIEAKPIDITVSTRPGVERQSAVNARHRGTKKHPSPNKEVLEDLEQAFRNYACLSASDLKPDEIDELAASFFTMTSPLYSCDKNQPTSTRLSASYIEDAVRPTICKRHRLRSLSHSIQIARISGQARRSFKLRGDIRIAAPCRRSGSYSDDIDELH
ncbi:hypothetical protein BGZ63DRAFT_403733 [Mariannaea sp. PMI_226]|nr:hypothetical protein BGZ63DRAFT_403733 [Mariannaea sp. PMI_226]